MTARLERLLEASAARWGDRAATRDPETGAHATYRRLDELACGMRDALTAAGVRPGDRVGVSGKSIGTVATIFGALKAEAAYVPVDAGAPVARGASIFADCGVRAIVAPRELALGFRDELGVAADPVELPLLEEMGPDLVLVPGPGPTGAPDIDLGSDLAYVLYTSGSTGKPKGVMHTHASALAFVDWCSEAFAPTEEDRFSSHAPFHFDLSILDIYVPLKHGAELVLIGDELGKQPTGLAGVIAETGITVWYSTPSILRLIVEYGRLERFDHSALRWVLFAGEVFPIPHLARLLEAWPHPKYGNLYGPTETNVCTYFELPRTIPPDRSEPFPIGRACSGDRTRVVDTEGNEVAAGEEGELLVSGGSVMAGYWNRPDRTAGAFVTEGEGTRWYGTGDLVREDGEGELVFTGRRDRMIKRRGFRIEPGEIEAALYRHPEVSEAAVLGVAGEDGTTISAFLSSRDGAALSMIRLKQWCAENLPLYMIPDRFVFLDELPKTSTDKIDYRSLEQTT